jgi:transposase
MSTTRPRYRPQFTFQLALEAAKGWKTIHERASAHGGHPTPVREWKRPLLEAGSPVCSRDGARPHREPQAQAGERYEPIGRLKRALEWWKKHAARFR